MRPRQIIATVAAATALAAPALLMPVAEAAKPTPATPQSLRELARPTGLRIGTAVNMDKLGVDPTYTGIVGAEFDSVTPENVMKWEAVEPTRGTYDYAKADALLDYAQAHGQLVRGHTLLWHNQLPAWLTTGVNDGTIGKAELRQIVERHVTDTVTHFRGRIWQWDVANEFFANSWDANQLPNGMDGNNFWVKNLGEGILDDVFRWAHKADKKALLFYNDFNIAGEDGSNAKFTAVYNWAQQARAKGVPVEGIGDQGHLDTQYDFPGKMRADLQAFADLGVKVAITEADVRTFVNNATEQIPTDPLAKMAQPYEFSRMLKACLLVRECISFTVWGVGDNDSWIPGVFPDEGFALLWDVNYEPKQAYFDLQEDLALADRVKRR